MSARSLAARANLDPSRPSFECRVYERLSCEIPAKCHPASLMDMKETGWGGIVLDISQGGVRIHLKRRFERGTGLVVELPGDNPGDPNVVFVKVVHLKRDDDGTYILGCQFLSALSEHEVARLAGREAFVSLTNSTNPNSQNDAFEEIETAELAEMDEEIPLAEFAEEDHIPWAELISDDNIEMAELAEDEEIILAELAEEDDIILAELADEPAPTPRQRRVQKPR